MPPRRGGQPLHLIYLRPTTYTPMQYRFPEGEEFKHADMKWVDYDRLSSFPVENPDLDGTGGAQVAAREDFPEYTRWRTCA